MQDQPIYRKNIIEAALSRVENLLISLKFIDSCFNFLHYKKVSNKNISLTYYYGETIDFNNLEDLIHELKRCILFQMEYRNKILIPADIMVKQSILVGKKEVELFYYGRLNLFDKGGWIHYCWYQSTPVIIIYLDNLTTGERILALFNNFQEAISDQIKKRK